MIPNNNGEFIWMILAVSLTIGLSSGYIVGYSKAHKDAVRISQMSAMAAQKSATDDVARRANPFESTGSTNPLDNGYQNPFDVELNPFK